MPIFLSYSRKDEEVVKKLVSGLERARREVWFDHDLGGGDIWWDKILDNIRATTVFVFAMSDASLQSRPCRAELDYAQALNRAVLPIVVGPITSFWANPLADLHRIAFDPSDADSGFEVIAAIDDAAKSLRPLPDPMPTPPPIPHGYLLALGRQIESSELDQAQQSAVIDQLRHALSEETDPGARADIVATLRNLMTKDWATRRTSDWAKILIQSVNQDGPGQESASSTGYAEKDGGSDPVKAPTPQAAVESTPGEAEPDADQPVRIEQPPADHQWKPKAATDPAGGQPDPRKPAPIWLGVSQPLVPPSPPRTPPPTAPPAQPMVQQPTPVLPPPPAQPAFTPRPTAPQPAVQQERPAPAPPATPAPARRPPAYWWLSILAVSGFGIFGLVALIFSVQVVRRFDQGDLTGARRASRSVLGWGITGLALGVIWLIYSLAGY